MIDEMDKFEQLAEQAISDAEGIDCPGPVFAAGLKVMAAMLAERAAQAADEFGED